MVDPMDEIIVRGVTGRVQVSEAVAAERERCAKVCDDIVDEARRAWKEAASEEERICFGYRAEAAAKCAAAIRRGE